MKCAPKQIFPFYLYKDLCHIKIDKGYLTHLTEQSTSGISQTGMATVSWKLGGKSSNWWKRFRREEMLIKGGSCCYNRAGSCCVLLHWLVTVWQEPSAHYLYLIQKASFLSLQDPHSQRISDKENMSKCPVPYSWWLWQLPSWDC